MHENIGIEHYERNWTSSRLASNMSADSQTTYIETILGAIYVPVDPYINY